MYVLQVLRAARKAEAKKLTIHKEKKKREARGGEGETQKGLGNLPSKKTRKNQKANLATFNHKTSRSCKEMGEGEKPKMHHEATYAREKIRNKRKRIRYFWGIVH